MLEIIRSGMLTLIEDSGRSGFQRFGMPESGAMDRRSLMTANVLVGNDPREACLEALMLPPTLKFHDARVIAVCGGRTDIYISSANGEARTGLMNAQVSVSAGDTVSFSPLERGCRVYVAVSGGIDVPRVMGSKSASMRAHVGGISGGAPLKDGDMLPLGTPAAPKAHAVPDALLTPLPKGTVSLRVIAGPEAERFAGEGETAFYGSDYTLTNRSDRMGLTFSGAPIEHAEGFGADIISDAIPFGTVQVPASGQPILMMADRQTTGGYTRIGCVISADLPLAAQLRPGDRVRFSSCSLKEAHEALRSWSNAFDAWRGAAAPRVMRVKVNGKAYDITVEET